MNLQKACVIRIQGGFAALEAAKSFVLSLINWTYTSATQQVMPAVQKPGT